MSPTTSLLPRRMIYVTPDCTDSAVQKRAHGFQESGEELLSFSFRRRRYNPDYQPDWPNVELGMTTERRLGSRIFTIFRALRVVFAHRASWREASLIYARNLDLAIFAWLCKTITRSRALLVYEVLDIHPALTRPGLRGAFARWLERWVLRRIRLLVVSSPAFLQHYFLPQQNYRGPAFLLENKWTRRAMAGLPRRGPRDPAPGEPPWTIGWFGNIRCHASLALLSELADAFPDRVRIYLRGYTSLLAPGLLQAALRNRPNLIYEGEYRAPEELPTIYSKVHFNWCIDLSDGDNSRWLLPNRLYEGGYFGVPALAVAEHETGSVVRDRRLGVALPAPLGRSLWELIATLDTTTYRQLRADVDAAPEAYFVEEHAMGELLNTILPPARCV